MNYIKINNMNNNSVIDYKGVDISKNIPNSQVYDMKNNFCITINTGNIPENSDVIVIDKVEYERLKNEIESQIPPSQEETQAEKINQLETALLETSTLSAFQQQQNEQAILELTMMIGGM